MTKKISFIIILFGLLINANAQELTVLDFETKEPIANVAVYKQKNNAFLFTDVLGQIMLDFTCNHDTVSFQHASYENKKLSCKELKRLNFKVFLVPNTIELSEFVVTASKHKEKKKQVSYKIETIISNPFHSMPISTSADLLTLKGNITIQKTQGGGGSPVLRGFEANKLLLVIDGVRMNNAIYRSGHLQNAITIDNAILEKTEIVFGPSSVIYGSDALGGSIHYFTKKPQLSKNELRFTQINAYSRYSSADDAFHFHVDLNLARKKIAGLSSITYKDFGNIKIGANRNPSTQSNYGLTNYYVNTQNNTDFTATNPKPEIQLNTAYKQYDFLQKLIYKPTKKTELIANLQYSTSSNISRYDKLNEIKDGDLKYAEYYYGPQNRLFSSLTYNSLRHNKFYTNSSYLFSVQRIDEDRVSRKFNTFSKLHQEEDLWAYAFNADFFKLIKENNKLTYGAEIVYNTLNSTAYYANLLNSDKTPGQTRYPNGSNFTAHYAIFANYKHFLTEKIIVNLGARYTFADLHSEFKGNYYDFLDFKEVNIQTAAPTGVLGFVFNPNQEWKLSANFSSGYRIPNIDDYGKIRAKNQQITIPAKDLKPEYAYNAEIGIEKKLYEKVKISFTAFHTRMTNAIVRTYGKINGKDSLLFDGDKYRIIRNTNAQKAQIYGFSASIFSKFRFRKENKLLNYLEIYGTFNYTQGRNITENLPLGHIPPIFGMAKLSLINEKSRLVLWCNYNGIKDIAVFSPYGEDNQDQAPEFGYPAWQTLNARFAYKISKHLNLSLSLENIFDKHYKTFASAISAPGRNLIISFRFHF